MSGNMNRIPQAQLDEWKWAAKSKTHLRYMTKDERILVLIAEVEDLKKTLAGFGEDWVRISPERMAAIRAKVRAEILEEALDRIDDLELPAPPHGNNEGKMK